MTPPGIYRHYKGGRYRVLFRAHVSTNGPDLDRSVVVYISLDKGIIHVRDEDQFNEVVKFRGVDSRMHHEQRFKLELATPVNGPIR